MALGSRLYLLSLPRLSIDLSDWSITVRHMILKPQLVFAIIAAAILSHDEVDSSIRLACRNQ